MRKMAQSSTMSLDRAREFGNLAKVSAKLKERTMDEQIKKFITQLSDDIRYQWSAHRRLSALQWVIMVLVAIAGGFTTVSGTSQGKDQWFSDPMFLVVWGGVTAIGAIINQLGNPGKQSAHHFQVKMALHGVKGAVEFQNMPIEKAQTLKQLAYGDPEAVSIKLSQWGSLEFEK